MEDKMTLMKEKIDLLNRASSAYYQEDKEIMSNFEYDRLYDELLAMEKETGVVMSNSPTRRVGYEVLSDLPKEAHKSKMLSLDKTKDREAFKAWLGDRKGLLSWKLDGLTIVLTYGKGRLVKALTRGNGEIGEVITPNAKVFSNIPVALPYEGKLVLRGEAVIKYSDFRKINASLPEAEAKYKNPRNLCSGSVRQLNSRITAERNVHFYAFTLVEADGVDFRNSRANQLLWLRKQGFDTVEFKEVDKSTLLDEIGYFEEAIRTSDVPSDGLVLTYDDMEYSRSLGTTSKFPRDSMAFKWKDQTAETTLREIEWSASRTGLINPVAVFDPVELEGTSVSRASVHNISIMKNLKLGIGDIITVYKANMIIPQIAENLTESDSVSIPETCPVCGARTVIRKEIDAETLYCPNPQCPAKHIKSFVLFASRDAMNIEGLSEATIEKFIAKNFIKEPADLFKLGQYRDEIIRMEGFGEKSFNNLAAALEKARDTTPERLLYSLGIPGIGVANARLIARACRGKWSRMESLTESELLSVEGIGVVMARAYTSYFADPEKKRALGDILKAVRLNETEEETEDFLSGMTFVITGSLKHYPNREALKADIEKAGGKVSGSVSSKTSYLINNDINSTSGKNRKARQAGVPVIGEDTVIEWLTSGKAEKPPS